jgi:protein involved in polysaccharide export with SLBB domain
VDEISAGGLTARELETEVEDRLREGDYLVDPHVSIQVLTILHNERSRPAR